MNRLITTLFSSLFLFIIISPIIMVEADTSSAVPAATFAYTSFEEPSAISGQYFDTGDPSVDHALVNNAGQPLVNYTSVGGELGFRSYYRNTRNDADGLTEGDYVGVNNFTGDVGAFPDGSQGFEIQDADGAMGVILDTVNLTGQPNPQVSIQYFVEDDSWETSPADILRIWVEVDGGVEIDLVNTGGSDIDSLGIEGSWLTAQLSLSGYTTASLRFELDSNASDEAVYFDNIIFGQGVTATITTIPEIQGTAFTSTLKGQTVETEGIVTGFFEGNYPGGGTFNGFFIQDDTGDGNPLTSDGIFVLPSGFSPGVSVGDQVQVTGQVQEFNEYDNAACVSDCMTQLAVFSASDLTVVGSGTISPTVLNPMQDTDDAYEYFEALEGMLVTQPNTATVVGPTNFGTIQVLAGSEGVKRALRGTTQHGKVYAVRHYERYGDINSSDPDNLIVGSVVEDITGPLMVTYGPYAVITQQGTPWQTVAAASLPITVPTWSAPAASEFSMASFNVLNLNDGTSTSNLTKRAKIVEAIVNMGCPSVVGLQEVDTMSTSGGGADNVLPELLSDLSSGGCSTYRAAYSHPDAGDHGVAALWDTIKVSNVITSTAYQGCHPDGSPSSTFDPLYGTCTSMGQLPTFSRRPLVLTGTIDLDGSQETVMFIVNHFKSKLGGVPADNRRLAQATLVRGIVDDAVADGQYNIVVLGDLNDFEDSPPLLALLSSGNLVNLWDSLPAMARYSYIFRGLSQALDHILVTPHLAASLQNFGPQHVAADYPYFPYNNDDSVVWRVSDHDPLVAAFETNCSTLPQSVMVATTLSNGSDVQLSWSHISQNTLYEIHTSQTPYFTPLTPTVSFLAPTGVYTITDGAGDEAQNQYYYVVARRGICGTTAVSTNRPAAFNYALEPGTS